MNRIPFHQIEKPNYLVIQFKNYKNILMIENYCSDPDCSCNEVLLEFAQLNETNKIANFLLNMRVNLTNGTILENTIIEPSIDADELIYEFHSHFNQFKNHFHENNQKVKRHFSTYHKDQLPEDVKHLIHEGNCVDYKKVFGEDNPITIHYQDETYLIEDQYCMNPTCSCNDVILIVFKPNAMESDFVFRLDVNTHHHELLKFNNNQNYLGLINDIIQNKLPVLKARFTRMKQVSKQFLSPKPTEKPKLTLKKVGRNEPCPCGSGKKYKKCCG